jgi:AcrR family transcriptional regulator
LTSPAAQSGASRFPGVLPPKPLLPAGVERRLTDRQRQLLDALEDLVVEGDLADLTMAEIAGQLNCSLRTLYEISPRKEDLVLAVVDRRLHRIGRAAIAALDETMTPLDALRVYLAAVNEAVQPSKAAFARDFANLQGAKPLLDAHEGYVMAVTRSLLDQAVAKRQIRSVDTVALAHVLGGLGREFARPDVAELIEGTPNETADVITDLVLRGLKIDR